MPASKVHLAKGMRCMIDGYTCAGTIRWIGAHTDPSTGRKEIKVGIELDIAVGGARASPSRLPPSPLLLPLPLSLSPSLPLFLLFLGTLQFFPFYLHFPCNARLMPSPGPHTRPRGSVLRDPPFLLEPPRPH